MHINPITNGVYSDLKSRQQMFVDALIDDGCSGYTVTRKQVVATAERCGYPGSFPWPSWLTADMSRRIDRGIFSLPELGDRVDTRQASDDLPETMDYIGNGLMAPDMTFSATCYNDGIGAVDMSDPVTTVAGTLGTELIEDVTPGQETDGDGLDDSIAPAEHEDVDLSHILDDEVVTATA
jgi:hypothetical protein